MMEDQPALTSPAISRKRNPPERWARPLYSQISTQTHHQTPHPYEDDGLLVVKVEVKEEDEEKADKSEEGDISSQVSPGSIMIMRNVEVEERRVKIKEEILTTENNTGETNKLNSLERCPRPLSFQNTTQQDDCIADPNQAASLAVVERKGQEVKETSEEGQDLYKEEKLAPQINAGGQHVNHIAGPSGDGRPQSAASKPPKKFVCAQCGKYFVQRTKLLAHERIHTGERPYSCSRCAKAFTQKAHLVTHEKTHSGEKPFSCSYCGKLFADKAIQARHEKFHSGEKPFACSECGKGFTMKGDLVKHLQIHTGERPFPCLSCGKRFLDKARLDRHELIHTGQKPFTCSFCGKGFALKGFLVMHERTHTKEKPYSCSVCGKRFNQRSNLATHERTHTGEKPFRCLDCGKSFTRKASLASHQVKPH